jgi:DNA-binding transcriptional ArsR family regulator
MPLKNFAVINHPARMRIFQALNGVALSINQLAQVLPDIPKPSLYRHVHKMLEAGVLQIARIRHVQGIEERFYIAADGLIEPEEVHKPGGLEQFADHVLIYGSSVAQDLARYIMDRSEPDLNNILARDYTFYASEQEFMQVRQAIYDLLGALKGTPPAEGRAKRRIFLMGHPLQSALMTEDLDTKAE